MHHGRLAFPPTFDDTAYFLDGAERVNALLEGGAGAAWSQYVQSPPHSPVSSLLCVAAFLLFGFGEVGPYILNCVVLLVLLVAVAAVFCRLRAPMLLAGIGLVLTIPLATLCVTEFRPDFFSALLASVGVVVALQGRTASGSIARACACGVLFGLAAITKPTAFPATLALAGFAACWTGLVLPRFRLRRLLRSARNGLVTLGVIAAVGAPYWFFGFARTVEYIRYHMLGEGQRMWVRPLSVPDHILYYISGEGGRMMLGHWAWPLALAWVLAVVLGYRGRRHARGRRLLGLCAAAAVAYVISTANLVKQEFFGLPFQFLLVFIAAELLRRLPGAPWSPAVQRAARAAVVLAAALALGFFHFPQAWPGADSPVARESWELYHAVFRGVQGRARGDTRVLLTFSGPINSTNLQYLAAQKDAPITFQSLDNAGSLPEYDGPLSHADLVLALPAGSGMVAATLPNAPLLSAVLARLRTSVDFKQAAQFPIPWQPERAYVLFERRPAFDGFTARDGLESPRSVGAPGAPEGMRWGLGQETRLAPAAAGHGRLVGYCRIAESEPRRVRVRIGGRDAGGFTVEPGPGWRSFGLEIHVEAGDELVLSYDPPPRDRHHRAVLFRALRLVDLDDVDAPPGMQAATAPGPAGGRSVPGSAGGS